MSRQDHESRLNRNKQKKNQWSDSLDASLKALTPEGIEFVLSPAGFSVRTFAYAIDKTIQWFVLTVIFLLFIIFLNNFIGIWIVLIFNFIIEWFYHVFFELFFRGQSPGKKLMGIRVVKNDGSPVDPASSFLRNLLRFADTFFNLFHVSFICIAASRGFRRIGDWAGGTLVVYSLIEKNISRSISGNYFKKFDRLDHAAKLPSRALSCAEKQAVLNFARRYPLLGEARANEIAGIYAPLIKEENDNLSDAAYLMGIARKLSGEIL